VNIKRVGMSSVYSTVCYI